MAEDVEAVLAGDAVVAVPILFRRVGFAEIDGTERQLDVGSQHDGGLLLRFDGDNV
jgi:hypothetical protein